MQLLEKCKIHVVMALGCKWVDNNLYQISDSKRNEKSCLEQIKDCACSLEMQ